MNRAQMQRIDRLVAEHVMGWKRIRKPSDSFPGAAWWEWDSGIPLRDWAPTLNVAQAFDVWTRLRELGTGDKDGWFCCMDLRWPVCEGFEAVLRRGMHDEDHLDGKNFIIESQAETPGIAICKVALRARGVEIESD